MGYTVQHTLPSYAEVHQKLPLSDALKAKIATDRLETERILNGEDDRLMLIIGPCSAWPTHAVLEYAKKLAPLAEKAKNKVKIIMRCYIQKPRTILGWMGPLVQPNPFKEPNIPAGIFECRSMMLEILKLGLPIADEILFPRTQSYFRDVMTWAAIGARSTENQEHRVLASLLEFAIGVKNPTSGNIKTGINSVLACQSPNYLAVQGNQVKTTGNPFAHLLLRGGNGKPNISEKELLETANLLLEKNVINPSLMIDASHENSCVNGKKDPQRQPEIIKEVLEIAKQHDIVKKMLKGFMVESYLQCGKQKLHDESQEDAMEHGKSITDGCIGWEKTEKLIEFMIQNV